MNRFFSVLNSRNLWAVDFPLFTLLAMEALSPGIIIHTATRPSYFLIGAVDLSFLWFARVLVLTFQKRAFVNSVFPTPVGPEKMKLAIGLFGFFNPTRALRIARETATTASS